MAYGALQGIRVLEFAGIGPAPFVCMLFADMGADVVRIDRHGYTPDAGEAILLRGRRSIALDLKQPQDLARARDLARCADLLVEGYRPGVMERLGLGPQSLLAEHPKLVYGRMTGWGQSGPLSGVAGHDINYLSITGALHAIGTEERPVPPLNLVGDFGGGAVLLAFGMLAALTHVRAGGQGQVVDCGMCDGTPLLLAMQLSMLAQGQWRDQRRSNLLDGGAPFYDTYRCADGRWIAVGALEARFFELLAERTGLSRTDFPDHMDRSKWPALRAAFTRIFASRTREDWCRIFEGSDACVSPVLTLTEAPDHPHHRARGTYARVNGLTQAIPAPRLSSTPGQIGAAARPAGADEAEILRDWLGS